MTAVTVSVATRTEVIATELLTEWSRLTGSEDIQALIARSAIDALLDLKNCASEYEKARER